MNTKSRKTAGVFALSAILAGGAGLAGCSTSTISSSSAGAVTGSDQATEASSPYEVECRRGIVNDPYPGLCRDYVDDNGNSICDLSEPNDTASSGAALASLSSGTTDDDTSGGCPLAPCVVCGICANLG